MRLTQQRSSRVSCTTHDCADPYTPIPIAGQRSLGVGLVEHKDDASSGYLLPIAAIAGPWPWPPHLLAVDPKHAEADFIT